MNERVAQVRKCIDISQELFGKRLGVTGASISRIEKGERQVTKQMVLAMCREFNIVESWLRTGEGEMFQEVPVEDEYFRAATEISKNNDMLAMQTIIEYWKLDLQSKELLNNFIMKIANKKE